MGWAVGVGPDHRWIGYGVPATCDHPGCDRKIDRGLAYACGGGVASPLRDDQHCDNFFCPAHLPYWQDDDDPRGSGAQICTACATGADPYPPKPDTREWVEHMLSDESWERWRSENPLEVDRLRAAYA